MLVDLTHRRETWAYHHRWQRMEQVLDLQKEPSDSLPCSMDSKSEVVLGVYAPQDIKNVPPAHPEVAWALPLYVVASAKGEQRVTLKDLLNTHHTKHCIWGCRCLQFLWRQELFEL